MLHHALIPPPTRSRSSWRYLNGAARGRADRDGGGRLDRRGGAVTDRPGRSSGAVARAQSGRGSRGYPLLCFGRRPPRRDPRRAQVDHLQTPRQEIIEVDFRTPHLPLPLVDPREFGTSILSDFVVSRLQGRPNGRSPPAPRRSAASPGLGVAPSALEPADNRFIVANEPPAPVACRFADRLHLDVCRPGKNAGICCGFTLFLPTRFPPTPPSPRGTLRFGRRRLVVWSACPCPGAVWAWGGARALGFWGRGCRVAARPSSSRSRRCRRSRPRRRPRTRPPPCPRPRPSGALPPLSTRPDLILQRCCDSTPWTRGSRQSESSEPLALVVSGRARSSPPSPRCFPFDARVSARG